MARYEQDPDLPQGVIPLPVEGGRERSGCGVRGCMVAAVALFALLLLAMVALALLRPWPRPLP